MKANVTFSNWLELNRNKTTQSMFGYVTRYQICLLGQHGASTDIGKRKGIKTFFYKQTNHSNRESKRR